LVHGFRCSDSTHGCKLIALYTANAYNAERETPASACTLCMAETMNCSPGHGLHIPKMSWKPAPVTF